MSTMQIWSHWSPPISSSWFKSSGMWLYMGETYISWNLHWDHRRNFSCDEYYTADSLNTLFETTPETCIVEFLWEAWFFYLIWTVGYSIQSLTWTIPKLMQLLTSWILHSKLLEDRLWDDPRGLHEKSSWDKARFLSDMNDHISRTLFKSVSSWRNSQLYNTTRLSL